jgi:hypothetical protein
MGLKQSKHPKNKEDDEIRLIYMIVLGVLIAATILTIIIMAYKVKPRNYVSPVAAIRGH